ncbi:MAG: hypothetical protein ACLSW1_04050 [Lachnospira sp.]
MKRFIKNVFGIFMSVIIIFCTSFVVKADYTTTGNSINFCYSNCGQYMGAAALSCDFSWSEGNYVTTLSVSTYFDNNLEHNYNCYFKNISKTQGTSNSSASAWCSYLSTDGICKELGYLDVTCDIYGDIVDNGYYEVRKCEH